MQSFIAKAWQGDQEKVLVCCSGPPTVHHRCLDIDTTLFDASFGFV